MVNGNELGVRIACRVASSPTRGICQLTLVSVETSEQGGRRSSPGGHTDGLVMFACSSDASEEQSS